MSIPNFKLILCCSIIVLLQIIGIWADTSGSGYLKDSKIFNGTNATSSATKHQVSIRKRNGHQCGGSLISENVVLTAAHCVSYEGIFLPENEFTLVMGSLDRLEPNNNTLTFGITKIIKPTEKFNTTTLADDIVLLILNGTVPAKHPTIGTIILNEGPIANNTICQATGWGVTEEHKLSDKLRTIDVSYIEVNHCRNIIGYGDFISYGMICAGDLKGERGVCPADSGGPLVCKGIQAGIVSFGGPCAVPIRPAVYADVAYYKEWILKELAHHNATLPLFASIRNGVTSLSCSMFVISLMLMFTFINKLN